MDILTLAATGAKYILKLVTHSKAFDNAKDDTLGGARNWLQQHLFKKHPKLEEKVNQPGTGMEKEREVSSELAGLLQNEGFRNEFAAWIKSLQTNPKVKNFFGTTIEEIEGD